MFTRIVLGLGLAALGALGQTKINGSRVVEGTLNYCADAGVTDDYACSLAPPVTSYVTGACYTFKANTANSGAATLNLNGLGAKPVKKVTGGISTELADNDIRAGQLVTVCYDGNNMQMQSGLGNAPAGGLAPVSGWMYPVPIWMGAVQNVAIGPDTVCHRFTLLGAHQSNVIAFNVTGASGTACTGGVCAFLVGVYDSSKTLIASSELAHSNRPEPAKNINQTGYKKITWASGSAVSNGVLTLQPGSYWLCYANESPTATFALAAARPTCRRSSSAISSLKCRGLRWDRTKPAMSAMVAPSITKRLS